MESVKGLHVVLILLVIVVLVSGCQGQTTAANIAPTATPVPTGPATPTPRPTPTLGQCDSATLPGHLLLKGGANGVDELTCTPSGTVQDQAIATASGFDYQSATLSPDGRSLQYVLGDSNSTSFQIVSQNLQTGVRHTYKLSGDLGSFLCVSWSPSGMQVSYVAQSGLILENLITGTHRVLVQEPSMNYSIGGTLPGLPVFGGIDCGTWISEDILLFHRFTGPFPEKIINDSIPTNTGRAALTGEKVRRA